MRAALAALALLAIAADRPQVPDATPTGAPLSCIGLAAIRATHVRDDRTIDFVLRGGRTYRNTLPQPCPELGYEQRFSYMTSLSQLCSMDIITVVRPVGVPVAGSCGLGKFQPVLLGRRRR